MLTESPLKLITYIPTNISKSWIAGAINIAYKTNIKFTGNWINKCTIKGGNIPIRNILPKEILEKSLNSLNNNKIWFLEQCVLNKNILADWEAIALNKIAKKPIWYKYINENWINIKTSLKDSKLDLNNFYNYAWQPNWNKLHKWYYIQVGKKKIIGKKLFFKKNIVYFTYYIENNQILTKCNKCNIAEGINILNNNTCKASANIKNAIPIKVYSNILNKDNNNKKIKIFKLAWPLQYNPKIPGDIKNINNISKIDNLVILFKEN